MDVNCWKIGFTTLVSLCLLCLCSTAGEVPSPPVTFGLQSQKPDAANLDDPQAGSRDDAAGFDLSKEAGEPEDGEDQADNQDEEDAESEDEEDDEQEPEARATLFAENWHRAGPITAEYLYSGQLHNNARGGISTKQATRYRGNLDLSLTLDTAQANWWKNGSFFVYLQQTHGRTLSQDFVGDAQFYNGFDTSPKPQDLTQLGEYWYQHAFADDRVSVKLGRQDANEYFAYTDLGGDFINSSFLTLPNIPLPTWPTQTLGVSTVVQTSNKLQLSGGAYDHGQDIGQWWVTNTSRGMFFIGQADYQPFAEYEDSLPTVFRFGSWYTSSDTQATDELSSYEGNYGFYATVDRMLFAESEDAEQGLGTFFQFSWAPADRNYLDQHYGAGLVYRGLFPTRDNDTLGIGFSLVEFSSVVRDATGQTSENAIELFYKARLRKWLAIQPDIQYIARPGGMQRDALVVGFGFEAAF